MKIRTGFVTNSSSSSLTIKKKKDGAVSSVTSILEELIGVSLNTLKDDAGQYSSQFRSPDVEDNIRKSADPNALKRKIDEAENLIIQWI